MSRIIRLIRIAAATIALAVAAASSPALQAQEAGWKFAGTIEIDSTQMAFINKRQGRWWRAQVPR